MKVALDALATVAGTRGDDLDVAGGGTLRGVAIEKLRWRTVNVDGRLLARTTRFVECRFVDWRVTNAIWRGVSFDRCSFERVHFGWLDGVVDMAECSVDGIFRVELSGRHRIHGNDFTRATGVRFVDGVDLRANRFAEDGSQLIVSRDNPNWSHVVARAVRGDPVADTLVKQLSGRQSFSVLYANDTDAEDWTFYKGLFGGTPSDGAHVAALPSFGRGVARFFRAPGDEAAWAHSRRDATEPAFDAELTPTGITALSRALTARLGAGWTLVREDDRKMLVRFDQPLIRALGQIAADQLPRVVSAWSRENEALHHGDWTDDPSAVVRHLAELARHEPQMPLYAVLVE